MKKNFRSEDGYILVFSLVLLPLFMVFGLLLIDVGRGNNAQGDLQAAADSVALAGARELDGRADAIDRARSAMAQVTNSVNMLARAGSDVHIGLTYANEAGNEFTVYFLEEIPDDDRDPIDGEWIADYATNLGTEANYVYVHVQSRNLDTVFFASITDPTRFSVPVGASAVATNPGPVACNVVPIYACNPFEGTENPDFNSHFADGDLYGRLFELHFTEASSPGPGNFGFLRVAGGSGASILGEALAVGDSQTCYDQDGVDTEPGQNTGPVEQAINTHFGLYAGSFWPRRNDPLYRPAFNVRMGQIQTGDDCRVYDEEPDNHNAMALPRGTMNPLPGGFISDGPDWDIDLYWDINHGGYPLGEPPAADYTPPPVPTEDMDAIKANSTYPGPAGTEPDTPSRYDTYVYEMSDPALLAEAAPNGETGVSQCTNLDLNDYTGIDPNTGKPYRDRRILFAAVINCLEHDIQGAATGVPAEAFVKMFLTKPAVVNGTTKYLSMEFVDITGAGGRGTLDELLRAESLLVR